MISYLFIASSETVLFFNCESIVNVILFCILINLVIFLNISNIYNIYIYYPMLFRRDLMLDNIFYTYIYKCNNLFIKKCNIIFNQMTYVLSVQMHIFIMYKYVSMLRQVMFGIYTYIESYLLYILYYQMQLLYDILVRKVLNASICCYLFYVIYLFIHQNGVTNI